MKLEGKKASDVFFIFFKHGAIFSNSLFLDASPLLTPLPNSNHLHSGVDHFLSLSFYSQTTQLLFERSIRSPPQV